MTRRLVWLYTWFLAFFRLNPSAVCHMAALGYDYHDYPDDEAGSPDHMVLLKCKRCGHRFYC